MAGPMKWSPMPMCGGFISARDSRSEREIHLQAEFSDGFRSGSSNPAWITLR
jgi:hypothetical protein